MQGQYYDAETGLCYNLFRYFDPLTGRFLSQDPLDLRAGLDPYAYASNVWESVDPLGLNPFCNDPARAKKFCAWLYKESPIFQELSGLYNQSKAGTLTEHEMEALAQHIADEEGVSIITHSEGEYERLFDREKSGPATVQDGAIHIIDDVFASSAGPEEVAHEFGAIKIMDALNCPKDDIPVVFPGAKRYLTHALDDVVKKGGQV
jgi:RHS repeat-associated protein